MDPHLTAKNLTDAHEPGAIADRLAGRTSHSYLGDFVLGGIDGVVTTFAVVCGVAGAGYSTGVALVLGIANLVADGFSMAASNFLGVKAEQHVVERVRAVEARHIDEFPDGEREEIRQIFAAKGFDDPVLSEIVDVITRDRRRWIDTMVTEEFGLQLESPSPTRAALTTYAAFVVAGFVPLLPFCFPVTPGRAYMLSLAATSITFLLIGGAKGHVVERSRTISALETLLVGGAAAAMAYFAGAGVHAIVSE